MKTIFELSDEETDLNSFVGYKVKYKYYKDDKEHWSDTIHTITEFDENSCGVGCCQAFHLSDISNYFRSSDLLVVTDEKIYD